MFLQTAVVPPQHNLVLDQVTVSAIAVWLIERAKKWDVPWLRWINEDSTRVNQIVAALSAAFSASVLHWTWDPAAQHLSFSGILGVGVILAAGKHWIRSFVWQEILYRGAVRNGTLTLVPPAAPPAQAVMQQAAALAPVVPPRAP